MALPVRLINRTPKLTISALVLLLLAAFSIQSHPDGLDGLIALAAADDSPANAAPLSAAATFDEPAGEPAQEEEAAAEEADAEAEAAPKSAPTVRYGKPADIEHLRIQHKQLQTQLDQLRRLESALEKQRKELDQRLTTSGNSTTGFVAQLRDAETLVTGLARKAALSRQEPSSAPEHLVESNTYTVVRNTYLVRADKAAGLVEFLTQNIAAEVEARILEPAESEEIMRNHRQNFPSAPAGLSAAGPVSLASPENGFLLVQVTAPADVQAVVSDLIPLMQGSEKRASPKTSSEATPNYFPTNVNWNFHPSSKAYQRTLESDLQPPEDKLPTSTH